MIHNTHSMNSNVRLSNVNGSVEQRRIGIAANKDRSKVWVVRLVDFVYILKGMISPSV